MSLPPPPPPSTVPEPMGQGAMTCYRHPGREAGRRCTRCGKPACPECLVQAAVGSHCIDCARAARPDLGTRARFWNARQPAMVTMSLITINVIVFVYTTLLDPKSLAGRYVTKGQYQLGLSKPAVGSGGAYSTYDGGVYVMQGSEWYRIITSGFVHYGVIHLAFNMYLLYVLGQMLEPSLGRVRFLLVYLAALLGGSAGELLLSNGGVAGGASGAVFGLMGLAFVGSYLHGANPLNTSIGTLLMLNLFITFVFPNISIGGHLGGVVAGGVCAFVVMAPRWKGIPIWATYAMPIAVATLSVVISVVAVSG